MARCKTLLEDPMIMYFVMWMIEVLITTWVIQYTWNTVIATSSGIYSNNSIREITFWEAFLLSLTVKLMVFGFSGFMMNN